MKKVSVLGVIASLLSAAASVMLVMAFMNSYMDSLFAYVALFSLGVSVIAIGIVGIKKDNKISSSALAILNVFIVVCYVLTTRGTNPYGFESLNFPMFIFSLLGLTVSAVLFIFNIFKGE